MKVVRVGLRSGMIVLFLLVLLVHAAEGQDRAAGTQLSGRIHIPDNELRNLFFEAGEDLVLTAFRAYDHIAQLRSDSIIHVNQMMMDVDLALDEDALRRMSADARLAVLTWELARGPRGESEGVAGMLVDLFLRQALHFGYEYARERVRAGSLSEMDYLFLPQGPGVTRTFNEVGFEARFRGDLQSSRIWREFHEARKNRISGK